MYWANYGEIAILNTFRGINLTAPTKVYAGLMSIAPTGTNNGTEVTYNGYERQVVTFTSPTQNNEGGTFIKNTNELVFPLIPVDSGTAVGIGLYDSLTGGNLWAYSVVAGGLDLEENEEVWLKIGDIELVVTGDFSNYFNEKTLNILNGSSITGFTSYLALSNGNMGTTGTEFSGGGYSRQELSFSAPTDGANEQSEITTLSTITFEEPTVDWGTWSHTAILDSLTLGNLITSKQNVKADGMPYSKDIKKGYSVFVRTGDIDISVN